MNRVIQLPMAFKVRWLDIDGYERTTIVPDAAEAHIAALTVAVNHAWDFAEFLGEPKRIVREGQ